MTKCLCTSLHARATHSLGRAGFLIRLHGTASLIPLVMLRSLLHLLAASLLPLCAHRFAASLQCLFATLKGISLRNAHRDACTRSLACFARRVPPLLALPAVIRLPTVCAHSSQHSRGHSLSLALRSCGI